MVAAGVLIAVGLALVTVAYAVASPQLRIGLTSGEMALQAGSGRAGERVSLVWQSGGHVLLSNDGEETLRVVKLITDNGEYIVDITLRPGERRIVSVEPSDNLAAVTDRGAVLVLKGERAWDESEGWVLRKGYSGKSYEITTGIRKEVQKRQFATGEDEVRIEYRVVEKGSRSVTYTWKGILHGVLEDTEWTSIVKSGELTFNVEGSVSDLSKIVKEKAEVPSNYTESSVEGSCYSYCKETVESRVYSVEYRVLYRVPVTQEVEAVVLYPITQAMVLDPGTKFYMVTVHYKTVIGVEKVWRDVLVGYRWSTGWCPYGEGLYHCQYHEPVYEKKPFWEPSYGMETMTLNVLSVDELKGWLSSTGVEYYIVDVRTVEAEGMEMEELVRAR